MVDASRPACLCDSGYAPQGLACVPAGSGDPCASSPCTGTAQVCVNVNGQASCQCAQGYLDQGGACLKTTPCFPNPCTGARQTTCVEQSGAARCLCDPGYAPEGTGCSLLPVWDCAKQHSGGPEDAYEPNECPTLATPFQLGGDSQVHSIAPAGDEDWIRISPPAGQIVQVAISNSSIPLYLDLYGPDGVTPIAANHGGVATPAVSFLAPAADKLFVRVRALRGNDTGEYTLSIADLGVDDYTNSAPAALSITPGSPFAGEVQYDGDVDYLRIEVQTGRTYRFALDTSTPLSIGVELIALDGTTTLKLLERSASANTTHLAHPAADGHYLLRAKALSPGATGPFSVAIDDLGVDDHGDVQVDATAVLATGTQTGASFERSGDVDMFSFPVVAGRIYAFSCSGCTLSMRDANGSVLASSSTSLTAYAAAEAVAAGTWYVAASRYYSGTGAYTWKLEDLGPDDHGDTAASATAIQLGAGTAGRIELNADKDVFSLSTVANRVYQATCTGASTYLCTLTIRDAAGQTVSSTSYGTSTTANFRGNGDTYSIQVSAYSSYTGGYVVTVSDLGPDDHGDTPSAATTLSPGAAAASGSIQFPSDRDVFAFAATSNRVYRFSCTSSTSYGCVLTARDPSGTTVGSTSYGTSREVIFRANASGTYSVEVGAYSSYLATYTYQLHDDGPDDHGDAPTSATAISPGAAATSGAIQFPGDRDVFTFAATAGQIYRFTCAGSSSNLCTLSARNPSGTLVDTASYGSSTEVAFKAQVTGTHSVEVGGYSSYVGSYTVQLAELTDDHGDSYSNPSPLALNVSTNGILEIPGDVDWFAVPLAAGTTYTVRTSGAQLYVEVFEPNGTTPVGSRTLQTKTFTATSANSYFVRLSGYSSSTAGAYTVLVEQ